MSTDTKHTLEEIAENLETPELAHFGTMYIKVVQDGVRDMTQRRISAKPLVKKGSRIFTREIDNSNLHNTYALFHGEEMVGRIFIDFWPHVSENGLKCAVEISLKNYPTDKVAICGRGMTAFKGIPRDNTKYKNIFLGPPLHEDYVVQ